MLGESLDLTTPQRIHIVGIGGAGMSAMDQLLAEMGHEVSGSDVQVWWRMPDTAPATLVRSTSSPRHRRSHRRTQSSSPRAIALWPWPRGR